MSEMNAALLQKIETLVGIVSLPVQLVYTTDQLTILLDMHENKINTLRQFGAIKAIKAGRGYIFPKAEVDKFLRDYIDMDLSNANSIRESVAEVRKKRLHSSASANE